MFQEILEGFEFDLFDIPVMLVPYKCPVDLEPLNKELARICGYDQDVPDKDGRPQQRVRAVWGGTERAFFCENEIFKYVHLAKKDPAIGINVFDESSRAWVGPMPLDTDKWIVAIRNRHLRTKGERWCQQRTRHLLACKVRDLQPAFVCVGRWRIYIEQFVHPDVVRPGWEAMRWYRDIAGGDIDQRVIDEYNDWRLYAKRLRKEHAAIEGREERKRVIEQKLKAFRQIARPKDAPLAEGPLDLPFELRQNLVQRRRDILGPPPEHGTYETLLVVQKEDGGYKPADDEVLTIVRAYWHRANTDALVKGVAPGHATPADQMANRVANIYSALRDAEIASRIARDEADKEEGFDATQLVMTGQGPRIITEGIR